MWIEIYGNTDDQMCFRSMYGVLEYESYAMGLFQYALNCDFSTQYIDTLSDANLMWDYDELYVVCYMEDNGIGCMSQRVDFGIDGEDVTRFYAAGRYDAGAWVATLGHLLCNTRDWLADIRIPPSWVAYETGEKPRIGDNVTVNSSLDAYEVIGFDDDGFALLGEWCELFPCYSLRLVSRKKD